ncbi:hypothetical protein [Demequina sp.]|uniref:hypothetical protein n=1 Tax=Demequina sp. TaxID=2050685 RepID=UPI003D0C3513
MTKIRELLARRDDSGVALLSVILLMTVLAMFAMIVLSLVISQVTPTLYTNKSSRTIVAAQAGIDSAVAQFRNATTKDVSGAWMGDIHKLPCTVTGTVDGTGGEAHYSATVSYFVEDPDGKNDAWKASNKLPCFTGTGVNGGLKKVPHFAIITSEGFDDTATVIVDRADRVIQAAYTFQLTTRKMSGGMVLDTDSAFCLVADSAAVNSQIKYQAASSAACADQTDLNSWSWRDDYMIHLTSTDRDGKIPLCWSGRNTANATPVAMTLQKCDTGSADPLGQRFSWTGSYTWRGQNAANTAYANSYIVNSDNHVDAGDRLSVANTVTYASLQPLSAVGKGNASYATNQVVNQNQFGRCLDVTNQSIGYSYMITYPCKQDPTGSGGFDWNHKWYYAEPGENIESVQTTVTVKENNTTTYCLTSTESTGLSGSPGNGTNNSYRFPKFNSNCSSDAAKWTRYGYNSDPALAYTIRDKWNRCLSASDLKISADTSGAKNWTAVIVATCNASDEKQKWNVPDTPVGASVGDFEEVTGRSD